jgi:hypothetical protein
MRGDPEKLAGERDLPTLGNVVQALDRERSDLRAQFPMLVIQERDELSPTRLVQRGGEQEPVASLESERSAFITAKPPADRDLTNLPESLRALEQHLAYSLDSVRTLERSI